MGQSFLEDNGQAVSSDFLPLLQVDSFNQAEYRVSRSCTTLCAGEAKCLEGSVSQSSRCQDDLTDPSLPLVEFTAQHLLMSLTCLMFEFLAAKGPSPKARTGTM